MSGVAQSMSEKDPEVVSAGTWKVCARPDMPQIPGQDEIAAMLRARFAGPAR